MLSGCRRAAASALACGKTDEDPMKSAPLMDLLSALYFSGAQASALIIPRCPWRIAGRYEYSLRNR